MKKKLFLLACVWAILLFGAAAWAQDFYVIPVPAGVGTRINSLPYIVTAPGFYYLGGDLTSTGTGITVNADNVTIELMGFSLVGPATGSYVGILLDGRNNVEVRNGTVRGFPGDGIVATLAGHNFRIISIRMEYNGSRGIHVVGSNHLVHNCNSYHNGTGISLSGNGFMVTNNVVGSNTSDGIYCTGSGHSLIGNVVTDNGGYGFAISGACTSCPYLLDRNTAYHNTAGTLNGIPILAKFGINAGVGWP